MDFNGSEEKKENFCTPKVFITFWKTNFFFILIFFLCNSHCLAFKISIFPFFSNSAHRKGIIMFARLVSVKSEIKWNLDTRNQQRSHQGWDFSSFIWVWSDAWAPALHSWSWTQTHGFWTQRSAMGPPCPRAHPKQHQRLSFMGKHILISSNISHWMFTDEGVLKMLSREVFAGLWVVSGPLLSCLSHEETIYSSCSKACCVSWMNFIHIRNWLRFLKLIVFSVLP